MLISMVWISFLGCKEVVLLEGGDRTHWQNELLYGVNTFTTVNCKLTK